MEKFSELIAKRRSMRKFTSEPLTADEVQLLLRSALISPTSKHTNGWQFIAVDDREILDKLADCKSNGATFLKEAPFAVVVLGDTEVTDAWIEDCAIAAIMILGLALRDFFAFLFACAIIYKLVKAKEMRVWLH